MRPPDGFGDAAPPFVASRRKASEADATGVLVGVPEPGGSNGDSAPLLAPDDALRSAVTEGCAAIDGADPEPLRDGVAVVAVQVSARGS